MIYTYRRGNIFARAILYMVLAATATVLFLLYPPGAWGLLFLIVVYSYALLTLSPAFTHHSLTKDWLIIRHGLGVKIEIPLKEIESCGPYTGSHKKLRTGVYSPWRERTAYVIADPESPVILDLAEPIKLPALMWKEVDSIVLDVEQRDIFLKNLRNGIGSRD